MANGADDGSPAAARDVERALTLAYRHLGRRQRSEAQLRGHLQARGCSGAAVDAAVAELARGGYVDDVRYARAFADDRRVLDGWGAERIERGLLAAGVKREIAAAAARARDAADELAAAVELLRRRWSGVPTGDRERERAVGLLVRRGYEVELAYDALRAFERAAAG